MKIDKNNKIFKEEEYLRDRTRFHVIKKNFSSETLELYSDEKNYVICRGREDLPIWVWTKDGINNEVLKEIENILESILVEGKNNITSKKELYDLLKKDKFKYLTDDYFEMGSLCCRKTKKPKDCDGYMTLANMEDVDLLTKYWYDDNIEMNDHDAISMEQSRSDVLELINTNRFYVWKDKDNNLVSMVYYKIVDNEAVLNHVYTNPNYRSKGYAANLIYELTNKLLNENLIPLLYTDYNYKPSNKAYINAGYEETGILINYSLRK